MQDKINSVTARERSEDNFKVSRKKLFYVIHRERITCAIFLSKQEGKKMISNVDQL